MVKKLILGLAVCCLFCGNCSGMLQRSKSDSNVLQSKPVSVVHVRKSSDPVTAQEKAHAIEITSMDQFRKLTSDQTKKLKSVTFTGMEINEEFICMFWDVFNDSVKIENLHFDNCFCSKGFSIACLIASGCPSNDLKVTNCGLNVDEASAILLHTDPYTVHHIDFSENLFKKDNPDFQEMLTQFVDNRMCLDKRELCVE